MSVLGGATAPPTGWCRKGEWIVRRFLVLATVVALAVSVSGLPSGAVDDEPAVFPYGVGSTEVRTKSASIWTQTTADNVTLEIALDPAFAATVQVIPVAVGPGNGGTVRVDIDALIGSTEYFYRFVDPVTATASRVGRFRTAPPRNAPVDVTFTFSGDQDGTIDPSTGQPAFNEFEVMAAAAADDGDFYVNLGDTIYADSQFRADEADTLGEYRQAYQINLAIDALRDLWASTSFYTMWDDHEVVNDWDADTVDPARRAAGTEAFVEYQGLHEPDPQVGFYRTFRWGQEAQIFLLDERSFRSIEAHRMDADHNSTPDCRNPASGQTDLAPTLNQGTRDFFATQFPGSGLEEPVPPQCLKNLNAKGRTMIGAVQRARFKRDLMRSDATWKIVFSGDPIQQLFALPYDRWEGYRWERKLLLNFIEENNIDNVVWLATDHHADLAHVVNKNTDTPGVGDQVQGMIEYAVGPVATFTFAEQINQFLGSPNASGRVRGFFQQVNENFCNQLGRADDPHIYSYGWVHIDAETGTLTIEPKDQHGNLIAGNEIPGRGVDYWCHNYVATAA